MADPIDAIFKALRLVPEFDGNPNVLTRFINLCDQLVLTHVKVAEGHELQNQAVLNGILNKVTGPAARLINSNGIPSDWKGIRSSLVNNFADQRDETALYNDLALQSQGQSTPQEFYERCQTLFSTIMTYVTLHDDVKTTVEAKRQLYKKLTLQSYLRGLKEPLGSRIRCMRPESIEQALTFVQEEINTLYLQQRNDHLPDRKLPLMFSQSTKPIYSPPVYLPPTQSAKPFMYNMPGPSRPQPFHMPQPSQQWRPNPIPAQFNRGPSRTQQMFRAPPPNYNPQSNAFKMPNRNPPVTSNNQAPKPMSGVSHFVTKALPPSGHDWRKFGNPPPSNYFKSREMNFNDCFDYEYGPHYDVYSDYYYAEPECYYYDYNEYPDNYEFYDPNYRYPELPNSECVTETVEESSAPSKAEDFQNPGRSDKPK